MKRSTSGSGRKPVRGTASQGVDPDGGSGPAAGVTAAPEERKSPISAQAADRKSAAGEEMAEARLTQKELAARLNRSDRQIRNLTKDGVLTRNEDGTYPWPTAFEQFIEWKQGEEERRHSPEDGDGLSLIKEQAQHEALKRQLTELKLQQQLGELMHISEVAARVRAPLEQVDGALKNAPSRHGAQLAQLAGVTIPVAHRFLQEIMERIRADLRSVREADVDDDSASAA